MFKYVSLFSGIGGFEIALNKLGGKCIFASEIDTKTAFSYEVVHGIKPHGDITKIDTSEIPDHDLLIGGFPCQAFSVSGYRKGFEDDRGTLFFDVARIAKEKEPKVLLLENVKGLISHNKGKTLETMIKTLSDIGYVVDFEILNSKYFGVPQNRERIFIVGILDGKIEPYKVNGSDSVSKVKKKLNKLGLKTFNFPFPSNDEITTELTGFLEEEVPEKYYIREDKTKKLLEQNQGYLDEVKSHKEKLKLFVHHTGKIQLRDVVNCIDSNYYKGMDKHGQRSHVLEIPGYRIRRLTPLECFRLQGFPDKFYYKLKKAGISDTHLYKMIGNAVTVNVVEEIGRVIINEYLNR